MENNLQQKDTRCYGIDLFKTLAMLMVVILHILCSTKPGGMISTVELGSAKYWSLGLLRTFAICAVNCFGIATGFLMVGRPHKFRKIIPLWLTVVFYTVPLFILGLVFFPENTPLRSVFTAIFPATTGAFWYFTAYFCLFFFIPFLNILIESLTKKNYYILLAVGFMLLSVTIFFPWANDPFEIGFGYTTWWLAYAYIVGAGIKKHGLFMNLSAGKALLGYVGISVFTSIIDTVCGILGASEIRAINAPARYMQWRFADYTSPLTLLCAMFLLVFCVKVNIPKFAKKFLKWVAPLYFQVYIIHEFFVVRDNIMKNRFTSLTSLPLPLMLLAIIGTAIGIFTFCVLVDYLRFLLFKLLKVNKCVDTLADKTVLYVKKKFSKHSEGKK